MHVKTMYINAIKGKALYPAHYQIVATYMYMRLKDVFDEYNIDSMKYITLLWRNHYEIH